MVGARLEICARSSEKEHLTQSEMGKTLLRKSGKKKKKEGKWIKEHGLQAKRKI